MENEKLETSNLIYRLDESSDFNVITKPKLNISKTITNTMIEKNISMRQLAEEIGMKYPQIHRVTSGNNYNINTLLKILDGLGLEIIIKKKTMKSKFYLVILNIKCGGINYYAR